MQELNKFLEMVWKAKIVHSIIIIIVSVILYKIIVYIFEKSEEKAKIKLFTSTKGKTYIKLIRSILRYIFIIITLLIVLQTLGINVSSVLAGVGIFGVVFGLAIQDWLKDIIRGSSIISDNYFEVGNVIKYNNIEGKVLVIGLKTTKIQELKTGNIISISNRKIDEAQIVSHFNYIKVPVPYDVPLEKAEEAINDIVTLVKNNKDTIDCHYVGVTELADSSIDYLLKVECNPINKLQVRRDCLRSILLGLEKHHIEVPFTQIDIHNK